jgi:hypothetical protein
MLLFFLTLRQSQGRQKDIALNHLGCVSFIYNELRVLQRHYSLEILTSLLLIRYSIPPSGGRKGVGTQYAKRLSHSGDSL